MFFVFGKCPFLLRWKNVLSGSHALHLRFIRNKSVTRTVISVNRPFIIRYTSGYRAFFPLHVRCSYGHCLTSRLHIQLLKAYRIKFQKFAAHAHKDALISEIFIPT